MRTRKMARTAREVSIVLSSLSTDIKNVALGAIAQELQYGAERIFAANRADLKRSERAGVAPPLLKRLLFDEKKLSDVLAGIRSLIALPDPVGRTLSATELDSGLNLYKVTCPIGVIGVIFESRPDALVQISTLCLKSANSVLLKGGSEAVQTNRILTRTIAAASEKAGIPRGWVQLLETREDVRELLKQHDLVDLIIPRGSNQFVRYIMDHSKIPVLGHAEGICHVYVDANADLAMAEQIVIDAKCQYVAVCNAMETLLVHEAVAAEFLPRIARSLTERGVELRGCSKVRALIRAKRATERDWRAEYLDKILSIRVVSDLDQAIQHINTYGSKHTDAIVTSDTNAAHKFLNLVDSANVSWNCSTRFSDGYRYGLGAEVGIATGKLHARGPVGLDGLVTYKWQLIGSGQIVAPYANGIRKFTHRSLGS